MGRTHGAPAHPLSATWAGRPLLPGPYTGWPPPSLYPPPNPQPTPNPQPAPTPAQQQQQRERDSEHKAVEQVEENSACSESSLHMHACRVCTFCMGALHDASCIMASMHACMHHIMTAMHTFGGHGYVQALNAMFHPCGSCSSERTRERGLRVHPPNPTPGPTKVLPPISRYTG